MDDLSTARDVPRDVLYDATKVRKCGIAQLTLGVLSIGCGIGTIIGDAGVVFYPVWGGVVSWQYPQIGQQHPEIGRRQ